MKIAVGYARRSKESNEHTISLTEQEAAIREYAKVHGFDVKAVVVDDGLSGRDRSRYNPILQAIDVHHAEAVVLYHEDRLHRDVGAGLEFARTLIQRGVELWIVGVGEVDVRTSSGYQRFMFGGIFAEYYVVLCSEKTKAGKERLRLMGRKYTGIDPYGYESIEDPEHPGVFKLVRNKKEQENIATMFTLRRGGHSLRQVALGLSNSKIYARNGQRFGPSTIKKILDRESAR